MYKYCEINDEHISLHDCHATNVTYENGVLTFYFDDGIWISSEYPGNILNKTVRTDEANVKFYLETGEEYDISIYVFEEKLKMTVREECDISKLIESINSKKCTLEFLYQYKGYNSRVIECWLWSDKKPFHRECELKLRITKAEYCWNNLCEYREW